ncbi:Pre-rRNA-processing protein TSR1-like protein [Armadillidium nasatum]|uniref:Pre-rRNA-processing protein TSR1-like protein n=1 Tax=Armadillidium nasatum TaxID=96803 RepID=A0A5N5TC58_9CRUS|nr:Pre-rRNA-processing protein TSR1-like protein [Armadillidium nasatum]
MVSVVPLSFDIDANQILHYLTDLDQSSIVNYSDSGIAHIRGSDTILFVWKLGEELKSIFETIISSLFSQGFHSVLHAVVADEDFSTKKKVRLLKELQSDIASRFTGHFRLFFLNKIQEINLLLSKIGSQKRKSVFYKDERPHIVAEKVLFEGEMDLVLDPFPLDSKKRNNKFQLSEHELLDKPNPELQESLESTCEGDLPDEDSMSQISIGETEGFETVEETRIIKKRGPKGFSSYQSAWLLDDKNDAREDAEFPDEMETPNDIPAKVRFQKYHGLESFKKSPWTDPYLPLEYEKIFNTKNFSHLKY